MPRGWSRSLALFWACVWPCLSALPLSVAHAVAGATSSSITGTITGSITGTVTDTTNKPLAGAMVSIFGSSEEVISTKTADDGGFTLDMPDEKTVLLRVDHPQFATRLMGRVAATQSLRIQLTAGFSLDGQVIDRRSGKPLAAAEVRAFLQGNGAFTDPLLPASFARPAKTGPDGRFKLEHLAAGIHTVDVVAAAHAREQRTQRIAPPPAPAAAPLLFFLDPGVELAGTVVAPDGKPVLGARVAAIAADNDAGLTEQQSERRDSQLPSTVTDKDGKFSLRGVPIAESYGVSAQQHGFPLTSLRGLKVAPGQRLSDIAVKLDPGATLVVTLQTPDGAPYNGILSLAYRQLTGPWANSSHAYTQWSYRINNDLSLADGVLHVAGLPAGQFELVIIPDQMANLRLPRVDLSATGETNLGTLKFERGSMLQGRLVDSDDHGVGGVGITAKSPTLTRYAISDREGRFRIAGFGPDEPATLFPQNDAWTVPEPTKTVTGGEPVTITLLRAASISGRVLSGTPPKPLAMFAVRLASADVNTSVTPDYLRDDRANSLHSFASDSGQFTITPLPPGSYNVRIEAEGFLPRLFENVAVSAGQKLDLGEALLDRGARLTGRVIDKATKQPVGGAVVSLLEDGGRDALQRGPSSTTAVTGVDGRFALQGIAPGSSVVRVESERLASGEVGISIAPNTVPDELTIELLEGGVVEGVVLDSERKPLADVWVKVWPKTQSPWTSVRVKTDSSGRYRASQLTPGPADVSATIWPPLPEPGSIAVQPSADLDPLVQEATISIESGKTTVVNFPLEGGVTLRGTVRHGQTPLKVGLLIIAWDRGASAHVSTNSDDSGAFTARLPAPGEYRIMLMTLQDDIPSTNFTLHVPPDRSEFTYDLVVPDASVRGRVVDGDSGLPLAAVQVELTRVDDDGAYLSATTSDADSEQTNQSGEFEIKGVEAGRYQLTALKPGYALVLTAPFKVSSSGAREQFVALFKSHLLTLRVVDMQGMPIPAATVSPLNSAQLTPYGEERTNDNGVVTLTTLPDGEVDVVVSAGGFGVELFQKLLVGPANSDEQRLVLAPENTLTLTIQNSAKEPVPGVWLNSIAIVDGPSITPAVAREERARNRALTSGADGCITVGALASGRYVLEFSKGQQRASLKVEIKNGAPNRATLLF
ncbi:MAG: carboxypeptidase-like regulatory domain-containing protein [Acidobacteriota bacterium]